MVQHHFISFEIQRRQIILAATPHSQITLRQCGPGGAWMAQLVKCPTSAQVMISQFVSLSPASGSVLTAQSLEPALESVSSLCPSPLVLSVSQINK